MVGAEWKLADDLGGEDSGEDETRFCTVLTAEEIWSGMPEKKP